MPQQTDTAPAASASAFAELVRARFSVRAFSDRKPERETLLRCLEAARLAPSACNAQPWRFIVADEEELVATLAPACTLRGSKLNRFVSEAPVIVAITEESPNLTSFFGSLFKNRPLHLIDIGIAAEHFCLQAAAEGLGTCMLGWFDERAVQRLLGIPRGKRVALLIAAGYPAKEGVPEKKRKDLGDMSFWNRY